MTKKLNISAILAMAVARASPLSEEKLITNEVMRRATIKPTAIDGESRRVSISISSETPVRVYDYWSEQYYDEVLLHDDENIDMSRAETAKFRYFHGNGKYGELPIGKLENVRIENKVLRAEAVFSTANPDAEMLWNMVQEGTLTEISVGASKQEIRVTERDGDVPLVEVTKWLFKEASLVDMGADSTTGVNRNLQDEGDLMNKIEKLKAELSDLKRQDAAQADIEVKEKELNDEIARVLADNKSVTEDLAAANETMVDLQRQADINNIARSAAVEVEPEVLEGFLNDPKKSALDFSRSLNEVKREGQSSVPFKKPMGTNDVNRAMVDALVMRAGVNLAEPHPQAGNYVGMGLKDLARSVTGYDGFNNDDLVQRAMSTSDFPVLLGNVANRILSTSFAEAEGTFHLWVTAVDVPDFKKINEVTLNGAGGRLDKLTESGEKKSGELSEETEEWKIASYGKEITLTREMIINDDMGAFIAVIQEFGAMAKRTANGLVYDLVQRKGEFKAYKMADSKAPFDTTHNNMGTGADINTETLSFARTKMRRQVDSNKNALNIVPKFMIVAPERENEALQMLNSEADPSASNSGVTNTHKGKLSVIVEAELVASEPWYLMAGRRTVKVGYLAGTGREPIVREKERSLSSITFECVFDFGVVVEDFRGLYKNSGVA